MYLVEKGFANKEISASKGKVIEIKDKKLASALLEAGFISAFSEKDMSNKEAKETIKKLEKEISDKDKEIETLNGIISELEEKLNANSDENPSDENDNLDNGEPPIDNDENGNTDDGNADGENPSDTQE